ncbi:Dam family site-specific DNA-(adenine-N6)-methyltransferase [Lacticaseibacillus porcinae]|uniref:Dam family site-specific DNA-(adenine-N6)-methyltransferase n=1 Tax=Lacticaseibacillus porcinae TaxID=1123687 RepID=UPI000F77882F|nr:Dam family site-specific DNA-(adenine-N6)-methyltransferase [Lacticaseibacillus porcinae]
MRFIGSKVNMLPEIANVISKHVDGSEKTFVDLFGGSNSVGQYFKEQYQIVSNDIMYFSYVIARASIQMNDIPKFKKLNSIGVSDPIKYLQSHDITNVPDGYVTINYSPIGEKKRMYLTPENARRIDFVRDTIERWHESKIINDDEFFYLLDALLQGIPYVSNITGTYGAYLKHWDKRAYKPIELVPSQVINNHVANQALNEDSLNLINHISGDIVYIDTPYNSRQYASNYHVLESIARWDKQPLKGVTGQRDYTDEKSTFAMKSKVLDAMIALFSSLNFKHVVVSYSTDGLLSEADLLSILKANAINNEVEVTHVSYRKYKSKIVNSETSVQEILFYFRSKNYSPHESRTVSYKPIKTTKSSSKMGFIKSPLNYVGGKYKLLPQIMPLFPKNIDTFVDLFSGGGNVGINSSASKVFFNDINTKINELFRFLQNKDPHELLSLIRDRISECQLSKTNEEAFLKFRAQYNANPNPLDLYVLVSYSFNYQFRFNNSLQYNNPFGRNRSHFSDRMANNMLRFVSKLNSIDAHFTDDYFTDFDFSHLTDNSFVYADPPYLITTGSYNDGNRGFVNWTEKQEKQLYEILDGLTARQIRFALSNVTDHKGKSNDMLKEWSQRYTVHELNYGYQNSSHNTVNLGSREVLITNY